MFSTKMFKPNRKYYPITNMYNMTPVSMMLQLTNIHILYKQAHHDKHSYYISTRVVSAMIVQCIHFPTPVHSLTGTETLPPASCAKKPAHSENVRRTTH